VSRSAPLRRWRTSSISIILLVWGVLQLGGLFTPGLLDDVDSVYLQIAREMLQRHDYVTPTIDGIRFFDKPPLMYWLAAGSMRVFGEHDWAARLPLALGVLALLLEVYALGNRLFAAVSPAPARDRAGLYSALVLGTAIGPYLYTRFYIPDILVALWMTVAVHLFLAALERVREGRSALLPMVGFGAVLALSVLTKGLIGVIFPVGFAALYLMFTRQLRTVRKLQAPASTAVFLLMAAPWHVLAALRNPAIAMPASVGLPAKAGWAWFFLYNEHVARFLGRRIPHDYGQVPIPLFWLLLVLWLAPWAAFLPAALRDAVKALRAGATDAAVQFDSDAHAGVGSAERGVVQDYSHEAALALLLWAGLVLGFFTLSSRQEYYHLPALPALAVLVAGLLASADRYLTTYSSRTAPDLLPVLFGDRSRAREQALRGALWFLVPLGTLLFSVCGYFAVTAPKPSNGATLSGVLNSNPGMYNLSLGHVFDLTGAAMGFFRGPLWTVALGMLVLGPVAYLVRRRGRTLAANLLVAASMTAVLMAAHAGLVRFYPILGSKGLALQVAAVVKPEDLVVLDGELTSGSTMLFYTGHPVLLVNGRVNGPWFGSFFPDAPNRFVNDEELRQLWGGSRRVFLLTYAPEKRVPDLHRFGPVRELASAGGKTVLTNR
jgi:4-amino-4-deoxy-L-arabinose transferase-like glycosyltransferase